MGSSSVAGIGRLPVSDCMLQVVRLHGLGACGLRQLP
jgi:hypothetical protein